MSVTISYGGTLSSHWTTTLSNGLFLCSRKTGTKTSDPSDCNGVFLAYSQDRSLSIIDDSSAVVYVGRQKPVAELGQYVSYTGQVTYRVPPTWMGSAYAYAADGTTAVEAALTNIVQCQHGTQANPNPGISYLCLWQDTKGRSIYGVLYSLSVKDLVDPAGWQEISFSFMEVYN